MNPVAFSIGNFSIYWYSLCVLTAFALGFFIARRESLKHININTEKLFDYFFYLVPIVIIGARAYYVAFEWDIYKYNPGEIIKVWNGGLAIHGGVLAGLIYTIIYTKINKINTIRFFDLAVPSLVLGQAIGRWGNFFNQEAYGPITTYEHLKELHIPKFIIDGMNINGLYHHPTFFYESLTCLLCFIIIILVRKYYKKINIGLITGIYCTIYGIERFLVEGLRQDSLMMGNFKVAQIVSIIMVIAGISFAVYSFVKHIPYIEVIEVKKGKKRKKKEA